jgi:hypothetical protein
MEWRDAPNRRNTAIFWRLLSLCMRISISAQKNQDFWLKKGANGHFSIKKDCAKLDQHRPNKITA